MKTIFFSVLFLLMFSLKAQIQPFTDHDWTIEKIVTSDNTVIMADQLSDGSYDIMYVWFQEFIFQSYSYLFSQCEGFFNFDDITQTFNIEQYSCVITPNHSNIADYYLNIFILQDGGVTTTPNGTIYGPFSYNFTYSGDFVYLHITNLAGSVATFYAVNLSQQDFLKDAITIYPNPVSEVLNIKNSGIAIDSVKIYNLNGRLVLEKVNVQHQINVSQLEQGVYILHIETAVGVLREELVKK